MRWWVVVRHHELPARHRWDYISLITYLQVREVTDRTGTESYLCDMIVGADPSWVPMHRAMCMRADADDGDDAGATRGDVHDLTEDLGEFKAGVGEELERLHEAVRALGEHAEETEARVTASAAAVSAAVAALTARLGGGAGGGGGGGDGDVAGGGDGGGGDGAGSIGGGLRRGSAGTTSAGSIGEAKRE